MPDLPTITVTQPQADLILQAFGGTLGVAVPAYKQWLIATLRHKVLMEISAQQIKANNLAVQAALDAASATLPPEPDPVLPPVVP